MVFVDANVLLDLATNNPEWADWSIARLDQAELQGPLETTDIVYAEVSLNFRTVEETDAFFADARIKILQAPRAALFLAARAHENYRRRGGTKTTVLPDFLIGAHAAVLETPLLTRDRGRLRSYFPTLRLVTPEGGTFDDNSPAS